jgi:hypothetical protein
MNGKYLLPRNTTTVLTDETNNTRTGEWKLDDNDIYFDVTNTGPTTTRRGPFKDADQAAEDLQTALTEFVSAVYARTTDPGTAGVPWNNAGVWTFSAGSASPSLNFSVSTNSQYIGSLN